MRSASSMLLRRVPRCSMVPLCCSRGFASSSSSSAAAGEAAAGEASRKTTHFGFQTVPEEEKERLVGHVFESVASQYDLMNDVMSAGVHRLWKDTMVGMIGAQALGADRLQVLDVAGGTGDIAFRIANDVAAAAAAADRKAPASAEADDDEAARIVVCDINPHMLAEGRRRAEQLPPKAHRPRLEFVTADARKLPFDDCSFDVYTIAFGIRNVTVIEEALAEARRVLRPGGRFLCLEFSHVTNPLLAAVYEKYSFNVIPAMGELVASDRASYQYLVESIRKFPKQEVFAQMMRDAGLRAVTHTNLTFGAVRAAVDRTRSPCHAAPFAAANAPRLRPLLTDAGCNP
jgi:2-methoxy-6-polyprenyl-1,4-benzoquinol methylase